MGSGVVSGVAVGDGSGVGDGVPVGCGCAGVCVGSGSVAVGVGVGVVGDGVALGGVTTTSAVTCLGGRAGWTGCWAGGAATGGAATAGGGAATGAAGVVGGTTVPALARGRLPAGGDTTTTGSPGLPNRGVPDGPCCPSEAVPIAMTTNVGTEASATSIPTISAYRRTDPATP